MKCISTNKQTLKKFSTLAEDLKSAHGDKYDYSLVEYYRRDVKVKILCPEHGVFEQRISDHIRGHECVRCAHKRKPKKTIKEFIKEANIVHKDIYNYSISEYKGSKKKIKILCPTHGVFEQVAYDHLQGHGCRRCMNGVPRKNHKDFIVEANKIHNNKYDYSLSKYVLALEKIKIICPEHGIFEQNPSSHLRGQGCAVCSNNIKKTTYIFIKKSKDIHKNKYDYSLVKYISSRNRVKIICPIHGVFNQVAHSHMIGFGCARCSGKGKIHNKEFEEKSHIVHNNKYDYSLTKYTTNKNKVKIICPTHGTFSQCAGHHMNGRGCPSCSTGGFDPKKSAILYYLRIMGGKFYKIGITNLTVKERFSKNDFQNIDVLKEWHYEYGEEAYSKEQSILKDFKYARYKGEKILESDGNSEMFTHDVLLLDI